MAHGGSSVKKTTLHSKAGYDIVVNTYKPDSPGDKVVLILPANGAKQVFYSDFAQFLTKNNSIALTFDYAGIGESKNGSLRNFDTSIINWGKYDLEAVLSTIKAEYPNKKLVVVAHSMGGQLIGLAPSSLYVDKLIFVTVPSGFLKFWTGTGRMKMLMTWYFWFPVLTKLFGYMPTSKISAMEDLPKSAALQWRNWCLSPNYMFDHLDGYETWYENIDCPLVSYSVENDSFAPKEAVDWLTNRFTGCERKRIHINPAELGMEYIGHFGFFKESNRDKLWPILLNEVDG